jgi:undecaprenyl diphosphate synthase
MNPSSLQNFGFSHLHVAIIMDGNGRWARARGLPRSAGHRAGVEAVRRVVSAAPGLGISTLTLHAFSSDNWWRPKGEVGELLRIFRDYIEGETSPWVERGVRLSVVGRRDRLPRDLAAAIQAAEAATRNGRALWLRLAIDYSGRAAILRAASRWNARRPASQEEFARLLAEVGQANGVEAPASEVDLLIRTGGEQRLSDFLLWELAYAELVFTKRLWPDFKPADLEAALQDFHSRERRFGRLPAAAAV